LANSIGNTPKASLIFATRARKRFHFFGRTFLSNGLKYKVFLEQSVI